MVKNAEVEQAAEGGGEEREELERKIKRTDGEIDGLVYRLYGLTEEERRRQEVGSRKGAVSSVVSMPP